MFFRLFLYFTYFFFVFYILVLLVLYAGTSRLRRHNGRRLDVVVLEVALEVEDSNLLGLRALEELAKRGIRVDVLLVVEAVLLDVVHDATGDVRAAHLRALGLAEEDAEVIRDLLRAGEDRRLLGEGVARLIQLGRLRAAATAGLLDLASKTLLELLHVGEDEAERVAELVDLGHLGVELGDKVNLGLRLGGCGNRYRGNYRSRARRGNRGRNGLGGLGSLGYRRGGRHRGRHYRGDLLLLGSGRLLRGGRRSRHLGGVLIGAHFILKSGFISVSF